LRKNPSAIQNGNITPKDYARNVITTNIQRNGGTKTENDLTPYTWSGGIHIENTYLRKKKSVVSTGYGLERRCVSTSRHFILRKHTG
jgi:hypothetical protein